MRIRRTRSAGLALATALLCLVSAGGAAAGAEPGASPAGPTGGASSDRVAQAQAQPQPQSQAQSQVGKPRPGDQTVTMNWQGKERTFRVHAPPGYRPSRSLPLVVALHPYPSDGAYMRTLSGFDAAADKRNFLVVYPDGVDGGFNALACCGNEDDVGFIRRIVKGFQRVWRADPDRTYATGISNGGDMSLRLAVELPGTFAAVAPVSSGFIGKALEDDTYAPRTPVSLVTFLGGADPYYDQFRTGLRAWHQRLNCRQGPPRTLPQGNTRTRAVCRDGSRTTTYTLPRMGHRWPGSPDPILGAPTAGLDATTLITDFFHHHRRKD